MNALSQEETTVSINTIPLTCLRYSCQPSHMVCNQKCLKGWR